MSRYLGPKLRITRRLGTLPGLTTKQSNKQGKPGKPNEVGAEKAKKPTEYGLRLEEKQKLKFNYGITEGQLYSYIKEARRRKGVTGLVLLQLLEMRLDTICFNLGYGSTIAQARQLVNHGHVTVNEKVVTIPSFQCCVKDIIGIKSKNVSQNLVKNNLKSKAVAGIPSHLDFNESKLQGIVLDYCGRPDILLELDELLIIEYYSRR